MYRAQAPPLISGDKSYVKSKKSSWSAMTIGLQSTKVIRSGSDREGVKVQMRILAKVANVNDATLAVPGALQPNVDSASLVLKWPPLQEPFFAKKTVSNEL